MKTACSKARIITTRVNISLVARSGCPPGLGK